MAIDNSDTELRNSPLAGFETPFETALDKNNRWVKLSECIPWDALADSCYQSLSVTHAYFGERDRRLR